ncbi:MAG: S-methyl-5-thioribose-1-phosphate isomerase [Spirochaetota bacterium]
MSRGTGLTVLDRLNRRANDEKLFVPIWPEGEGVALLDQTRLPFERKVIQIRDASEMAAAIRSMQIRGSGALGCAGAWGAYLAVRSAPHDPGQWNALTRPLREARPTAVILRLATEEVLDAVQGAGRSESIETAASAAAAFVERQLDMEQAIGRQGTRIIPDGATVLTHCHSGALAGAGYGGRAISVIRAAAEAGKHIRVISQETRPYFQGARLTVWELRQLGIPVFLITDGMSGAMMQSGQVDVCLVGSDRLAINGDLANKVGTYLIALAAREHGLPFYTATTRYNIDPDCASGDDIPIEMRSGAEILSINGSPISVEGVEALYPVFDITPASLLTGIITESGIFYSPFKPKLYAMVRRGKETGGRGGTPD